MLGKLESLAQLNLPSMPSCMLRMKECYKKKLRKSYYKRFFLCELTSLDGSK